MGPQKPTAYRLKELTEIAAYLLDEIKALERLIKKIKRFNTIISVLDTGLIKSTGVVSIAAFASDSGLQFGLH